MWVLSRPEVGTEVRAWFFKVFGACRSDWEALPAFERGRKGRVCRCKVRLVLFANPPTPLTDLAVYLLEVTQCRSWGIGGGLITFCE